MGNNTSSSNSVSFALPERAVVRVASFLTVKDIISVAQTSHMLNSLALSVFVFFCRVRASDGEASRRISCDNKIWRQVCLRVGWGGRITSTHAVRKKWKEVYVQQAMLARQRRLQIDVAKPAVLRGPT